MDYFTFKQAAELYGKTPRTLRNWWTEHREKTGVKLGKIVGSARKFSTDDLEILASYGRENSPIDEVIQGEFSHPEDFIDPATVTSIEKSTNQAVGLLNFNVTNVVLHVSNADTTDLETQADMFQDIHKRNLLALGKKMKADLKAAYITSTIQNRQALLGLQAQASTEVIREIGEE